MNEWCVSGVKNKNKCIIFNNEDRENTYEEKVHQGYVTVFCRRRSRMKKWSRRNQCGSNSKTLNVITVFLCRRISGRDLRIYWDFKSESNGVTNGGF